MALVPDTTQSGRARIGRPLGSGTLDPKIVKLFVADYKRGLSIRQIADLRDYAYSTIRRRLVTEGVKLRPRGGRAR